ncbi:hypothetical protein CI102_9836 [Trichoderma harzianum]|nr:hypothetical protein CI102_9836 [Trichoderma harzianum]
MLKLGCLLSPTLRALLFFPLNLSAAFSSLDSKHMSLAASIQRLYCFLLPSPPFPRFHLLQRTNTGSAYAYLYLGFSTGLLTTRPGKIPTRREGRTKSRIVNSFGNVPCLLP